MNNAEAYGKKAVELRMEHGGLLQVNSKIQVQTREDLATAYTPGVAEPCRRIAADPALGKTLTQRKNTVAVVSDGSAVLGLGNIGPQAALPVMEGKAILFQQFGGVDAYPIVLDTQDTQEIINTVRAIAPSFGGINLEDISAPRCFEILRALEDSLDIPVFHDDQDGTAIVVLAALQNALQVVGKQKQNMRVVLSGAGAAGIAIGRLLQAWGVGEILLVDSKGIVSCPRPDLGVEKRDFCTMREGTLADALSGADVFLGVSKGGLLTPELVGTMAKDAIVFAMANPEPEILPPDAHAGGAAVVATGRSDYPNQINNVLVFPGLFRGLLDTGVKTVTTDIKLNAAKALAALVPTPSPERIIPDPFDPQVPKVVAAAVQQMV